MRLTVNGQERHLEGVTTVADLLRHFGVLEKMLVVEHNRSIVSRDAYEQTRLADGDQLEIVHFVGGG
jgi:thiamine biosynthesis protein ThiS